jgi:cyclopropane fatty-acyl-phospholipid synthase-like methyltransferase
MSEDREHFIARYASAEVPWDIGHPDRELVRVLATGAYPGPESSVLELGCGTGTNAIELARRGYLVTAVDFVPAAIRKARDKAQAAGVEVDFREADLTRTDLGGPYDALFDRGLYHGIRRQRLSAFLDMLCDVTGPGTRWLCLAGNAKEQAEYGPPRVHEQEIRAELGPLFDVLEMREYWSGVAEQKNPTLWWSILMERRAGGGA